MSGDNKTTYDYLNILRVLAAFAVVLLHVSTSVVQDSGILISNFEGLRAEQEKSLEDGNGGGGPVRSLTC